MDPDKAGLRRLVGLVSTALRARPGRRLGHGEARGPRGTRRGSSAGWLSLLVARNEDSTGQHGLQGGSRVRRGPGTVTHRLRKAERTGFPKRLIAHWFDIPDPEWGMIHGRAGVAGGCGWHALGLTCHSSRHMGMPGLAPASGFRVHTDVLDGISRI